MCDPVSDANDAVHTNQYAFTRSEWRNEHTNVLLFFLFTEFRNSLKLNRSLVQTETESEIRL